MQYDPETIDAVTTFLATDINEWKAIVARHETLSAEAEKWLGLSLHNVPAGVTAGQVAKVQDAFGLVKSAQGPRHRRGIRGTGSKTHSNPGNLPRKRANSTPESDADADRARRALQGGALLKYLTHEDALFFARDCRAISLGIFSRPSPVIRATTWSVRSNLPRGPLRFLLRGSSRTVGRVAADAGKRVRVAHDRQPG